MLETKMPLPNRTWDADRAVAELRARGELFEAAPGVIGLRGGAARLHARMDAVLAKHARAAADEEWIAPAAVSLATLARADYFASFPHWLTAAAHLSDEPGVLERLATAADPAHAVGPALTAPTAAMPPAVCYNVYAALAGRRLEASLCVTVRGTCWRHEGCRTRAFERGWAFTMREVVRVSEPVDVEAFRQVEIGSAQELAQRLGLRSTIEQAEDPFFAPTARGKALLQRLKSLKHELLLPIGGGRTVAAGSFNHHEAFFGEAFEIRLGGGGDSGAAATGCVAFGVERWMLAVLVAHGPDEAGWPDELRGDHA